MARIIKTLLLCKLRPEAFTGENERDYSEVYRKIYTGPGDETEESGEQSRPERAGQAPERYLTIGSVDAISIYDTVASSDSPEWFEAIYADKLSIIQQINESVIYHPIHLVANADDGDPVAGGSAYPFCVVTLIYGIDQKKESPKDGEKSRYEFLIKQFVDELLADKEPQMVYTVYNAVNICDAAIIWYTRDILETLDISRKLTTQGLSRKTFTLVGFPMDAAGNLPDQAKNAIPREGLYNILVQGSIRNQTDYEADVRDPILNLIQEKSGEHRKDDLYVFGSEDFSILLRKMRSDELKGLLNFYFNERKSRKISNACWDIHSEFLLGPDQSKNKRSCPPPQSILSVLYREMLSIGTNKAYSELRKAPWFGAFCEVLSVYSKIDQHPILYGPCYLVYDLIKIANHYFKQAENGNTKQIVDSLDSLQEFVRNWSEFTDQMIRVDDMVFHGFGSTSALYNTLPECALDFYHAFLVKYVDLLIAVDYSADLLGDPDAYAFDFLLVPELHRGISITPLFNPKNLTGVNKLDEAYKSGKMKRRLLPYQQAYLVRFPIGTVFSPGKFFAPLMHECFHYYGDACRLRQARVSFVLAFVAARIACSFQFQKCTEEDQTFFKTILQHMMRVFADSVTGNEPTEEELRIGLENSIQQLFTIPGFEDVNDTVGSKRMYEEDTLLRWDYASSALASQDRLWKDKWARVDWPIIIDDAMYYFRECYADLMMILTLNLSFEDYIALFAEDFVDAQKRFEQNELIRGSQRIAIVTAARYLADRSSEWSQETIEAVLPDDIEPSDSNMPQKYAAIIKSCVNALINPDAKYKDQAVISVVHPPLVLSYVIMYLKMVYQEFGKRFQNPVFSPRLVELQTRYENIFKHGQLLNREFFTVIHEHHESIRKNCSMSLRIKDCMNHGERQ